MKINLEPVHCSRCGAVCKTNIIERSYHSRTGKLELVHADVWCPTTSWWNIFTSHTNGRRLYTLRGCITTHKTDSELEITAKFVY